MDFVAIDFETANREANSACQLAAVIVRGGEIVSEHEWLIRPPRMYFSPFNIAVHGIRPADVVQSPNMEQVWSELQPLVDGQVLVAHNARFDVGVLLASLAAFEVACPAFEFTCTRALARAAWPGRGSYGLKPLASSLGLRFQHHDALEDARVCAKIALAVRESFPATDLRGLEEQLKLSRGRYDQGQIKSPRLKGRKNQPSGGSMRTMDRFGFPSKGSNRMAGQVNAAAVVATAEKVALDGKPLVGKRIVLLGPLRGLDLGRSIQLLERLGATVDEQIQPGTDYVVACGTPLEDAAAKIRQLAARNTTQEASDGETESRGVRLLSERQFMALLPGGSGALQW